MLGRTVLSPVVIITDRDDPRSCSLEFQLDFQDPSERKDELRSTVHQQLKACRRLQQRRRRPDRRSHGHEIELAEPRLGRAEENQRDGSDGVHGPPS
jgi:hypothetical protein